MVLELEDIFGSDPCSIVMLKEGTQGGGSVPIRFRYCAGASVRETCPQATNPQQGRDG